MWIPESVQLNKLQDLAEDVWRMGCGRKPIHEISEDVDPDIDFDELYKHYSACPLLKKLECLLCALP